jgi:glycolate oxidase
MAMQRMNKVIKVSVADLWVDVEPGINYNDLNDELAKYGFFFPPTPGSAEACQIGGMVSLNASGMKAVKYGATRDYVLGLTYVKADGEIVRAGTRTIKDSSGYQLARLMCGSEGTLGIITEVTLKLTTKPKKSAYCLCTFNTIHDAGRCIAALIAKPMIPASCELMDSISIKAVNKARGNPVPDCEALCIFEADGESEEIVKRDLKIIEEVALGTGAVTVTPSWDQKQIDAWTDARKSIMTALSALKPGYAAVSLADDMGVPISNVPEAVRAFQEIAEKYDVTIATYGHAGDGNLHTKMLIDPTDADQWVRAEKAVDDIFDVCIDLGGTVTGEHGVGIAKANKYMRERQSELSSIIAIKKAMDPNNILNPGKLEQWEGSILTNLRYPCADFM